ncbi:MULTISPECIES: carbohydrate-binding family 9-like protein [Paenibacillus]|uniref:Carbohydrate-binding family 9-like protein n=1 Tax=Paenibacillus campinasensis TaxID=66347 RepID=A0A268EW34_9BACL|nr:MULTISPECIES: carbohydrate-binding family 9-like protein [Paenibacillus]MUG68459.1 carbohydrate-binding family 9-like protein [Paenibacillus campinasensis]PAD77330.1 carbohydrate-binding family 9-like protein [Paenibacillus campinasensis]PAK50329.1 carbohydrate-binding family 9-like protein [Paenibacillus sp. 7541]
MNYSGVPEPGIEVQPKHYICRRASGKLKLDGRLDKPFWEKAEWTEDFVDIEGELKPRPPKRTRVKMLWDDDYFYVGAELEEDEIWATLTERDSVIFHDNDFEIFIDPDGDTHNYYEFEINAWNTVWDLLLPKPYRDGGPAINGWDIHGLETAVYIEGEINNPSADNRKWSLEVAMPWSSLKECAPEGRGPRAGECWRVNFSRVEWHVEIKDGQYVKRLDPATGKPLPEENWVWSPMGIINMHYPELWGYVMFADHEQAEFALPPDEGIKRLLRKVYYRQRNYYAEHGVFSDRLDILLGEAEKGWDDGLLDLKLETTSSLFQVSARSSDGRSRVCIREDGKLWTEQEGARE